MEDPVIRKLRTALKADGFDALIAHSLDNATYTAGFQVPSHAMNRFRRTITVIAGEKFGCQIVVNVEEALAREKSRFEDIRSYNQFTDDPADLLADALTEAGVSHGRIAIELDYLPAMDFVRLTERLPKARFVHARDLYFRTRMVKTDEEVAILRQVGEETRPAQLAGDGFHGRSTPLQLDVAVAPERSGPTRWPAPAQPCS